MLEEENKDADAIRHDSPLIVFRPNYFWPDSLLIQRTHSAGLACSLSAESLNAERWVELNP